ncbi:lipid-binding SYLF domain-containing protein [Thiovibrio sp. JS02]
MTALLLPVPGWSHEVEVEKVEAASAVLDALSVIPEQSIPPVLLREAQALVVIPAAVKIGFMVAGRHGTGIMVGRDENGEWGLPFLVNFLSGSLGWQFGLQSTDVVLVFKNRRGLYAVRDGKFTLGVDASVAAGPVGRHLEAATDLQLNAEIYSYSRSKGVFVGAALEGSVLQADRRATENLYGQAAETISGQSVRIPPSVARLRQRIQSMAR